MRRGEREFDFDEFDSLSRLVLALLSASASVLPTLRREF